MKCKNNDMARHVRVRAVVAYPALSATLVVSIALALTSFSPSQDLAHAATPTPPVTTTSSATPTATPTTATPTTATPTTATAAPSATPSAAATPSAPSATPSPIAIPSASSGSTVTPGSPVDHHVLAWIGGPKLQALYLPVDALMADVSQFQTIRMRFKLHNSGTAAMTAAPQLEYRVSGSKGYTVVPEALLKGIPFRVDREWVPIRPGKAGTKQGPLGADIAVTRLLTGREGGGRAVTGHHSMGANPDRALTLEPGSYTEQEFTVQVTSDARSLTGYEFRITDGHSMLAGSQIAAIRLGAPPKLTLSPRQQQGLTVRSPKPANRSVVVK